MGRAILALPDMVNPRWIMIPQEIMVINLGVNLKSEFCYFWHLQKLAKLLDGPKSLNVHNIGYLDP